MALPTFTPGTQIRAQEMNDALATLFDMMYPVGSIYMSASLSTAEAVNNTLPGTWQAWGAGRVPIGVNASDTDFDTAEETGGAKTHNLPLTRAGAAGIRNYADKTYVGAVGQNDLPSLWNMYGESNSVFVWSHNGDTLDSNDKGYIGISLYGNTGYGDTMPPYITCYMYKRVS